MKKTFVSFLNIVVLLLLNPVCYAAEPASQEQALLEIEQLTQIIQAAKSAPHDGQYMEPCVRERIEELAKLLQEKLAAEQKKS